MKKTIDGKRYDTEKCELLGSKDRYNHSNNYAGSTRLYLARNGKFLVAETSNGQDLYRKEGLFPFEESGYSIDEFDLDEDQEKRCAELGLIDIVD